MIKENNNTSSVFDRVGKQMPYSVPDGFFDSLEKNISRAIESEKPTKKSHFRFHRGFITAASIAAVAMLSGALWLWHDNQAAADTETFESAFYSMSQEDQATMLDIYANDVFMEDDFNQ